MRMALTVPIRDVPLVDVPAIVRRAESAGYDSIWSEESTNYDGFSPLVVAAQHTERMRLATGIVNVYTRGPALLAQSAAALADLSGGRFILGLGASSNVIVEQWNRIPFERPLTKVRETVEILRAVLAGERGPGGFRLSQVPPPVPIVLAALRERMLRLAGEIADGAFANFLPLSGAPRVVDAFGAPEKELACRFFSIDGPEDEALAAAKRIFVAYATVPVYTEFFCWLGFGEELDPVVGAWTAGDRKRAVELAPDRLVREIFLLGPVEAQRERLAAFAEAGIDTAVLLPFCPPDRLAATIDAFGA
ncbi:MAG: LLM class F420-dependent oxidoreductase [Actinobacteria bacterium]|nr:MAG: LLM class F420-dependent oxidoreductase [Actinomycetota bacterium]